MSVSLVLTAIGDDRPGLVEQLSTVISRHNGNWLESSSPGSSAFQSTMAIWTPSSAIWGRCRDCASRPKFPARYRAKPGGA